MTYVLDANAIVALLKNEDGADVVDNLLVRAAAGDCSVCMNKFNLLEVYYGYRREDGEAFAEAQIKAIRGNAIEIIELLSDDVFRQACECSCHNQHLLNAPFRVPKIRENSKSFGFEVADVFCNHNYSPQ